MAETTLFSLPTAPNQFGVLLPPAELRKLDFSALEFTTARRAVLEYIQAYFPDDFNDFVSNNGIMMLVELLSYLTALLSLRADILGNESYLPTSTTEDAVINHLTLIDQVVKPATAAYTDVEVSVGSPLSADVAIPPSGLLPVEIRGEDGQNITYEIFASPDDVNSPIVIPAGKRAVIAYGIEGKTIRSTFVSDGTTGQVIEIANSSILSDPIKVFVTVGNTVEEWKRVDLIERSQATDKSFEVRLFASRMQIVFGDNVTGRSPVVSSSVEVVYRTGGGVRGRIGAGVIDTQRPIVPTYPYTAPVLVRLRNLTASIGGRDRESIEQAKKRAPREFATQRTAVTDKDYAQLANSFTHSAFGSISKAVATVRTGLNANMVEVYALADGIDGKPTTPSAGLKKALQAYLDEINVLTDTAIVKDGHIRPVDLEITVVMNRNADATVVRGRVESTITEFFALDRWDMGQPMYVSQLYSKIAAIDGVAYIDLFKPTDNILPTKKLYGEDDRGVAINEVVTLGDQQINYYYEAIGQP